MSITDMIVPGLTFNKEGLGKVGKDDSYNLISYIIVGLYVILIPLVQYLKDEIPPASGLSDSGVTGFGLFLGLFLSELFNNFLLVYFISLIAKYLFKIEMPFMYVLRVFAAVMIWYYISFLLGLAINLSFGVFLFLLLFNVALMIGLTNTEGLIMWKSFLSIVLAFILVVLVNGLIQRLIIIPIFG